MSISESGGISDSRPEAMAGALIKKALLITVGMALLFVALGNASWARGVILGGLASAANFYLMAMLLPRALGQSRRRAEGFSLFSLVARFGLMALALGLALTHPNKFAVGACAGGLFAVQVTIFLDRLVFSRLGAKA